MAVTEKALGLIADIGIAAAKGYLKLRYDEVQAKKMLVDYLTRQEKYNIDCTLEEEIDFEGLAAYIRGSLMDDVQLRLFGTRQERGIARQTIADKAANYAHAETKLSEDRAKHLATTAVEMLRYFYRNHAERGLLYVAAEIEDTIISEVTNQGKEISDKVDALAQEVHDTSLLSIDRNVSLLTAGETDKIEKNLSTLFAGLSENHRLAPYYGFSTTDDLKLKSVPLLPNAEQLYPPHFEITAKAFTMNGTQLPNIDSNALARSYRSQSPIEFDVIAAKKYLGDVLDPFQHEAEKLAGSHVILKPPSFPKAFPCSVLIDGKTEVGYLLLRTKSIKEDGTFIITNDEQNNFKFRVVLEINTSTTTVNVSITPNGPSNAEFLSYKRFLRKAMLTKQIELKALEQNVILISSRNSLAPHDCKDIDGEIEFLEKIVVIEEYFHVTLTVPEKIEVSEQSTIDQLSSMIVNGEYRGTCGSFTMSLKLTKEIRQSLYDIGDRACMFSYDMDTKAELFGQEWTLQIRREINCMRVENYTKVMKLLEALDDGDSMEINFVSGNDDPHIHYSDRIYSEDGK